MARFIPWVVVLICSVAPAVAEPSVHVTVDGTRAERARGHLIAALSQDDARSFDVTVRSHVTLSGRRTADVTVQASAVVSDRHGMKSVVSVSACTRGKAKHAGSLRAQATRDALQSIASRLRVIPR